jgi:hypothetical protein
MNPVDVALPSDDRTDQSVVCTAETSAPTGRDNGILVSIRSCSCWSRHCDFSGGRARPSWPAQEKSGDDRWGFRCDHGNLHRLSPRTLAIRRRRGRSAWAAVAIGVAVVMQYVVARGSDPKVSE